MSRVEAVSRDVYRCRTLIANVFFVRDGGNWVLVDAGIAGYMSRIKSAAAQLFGTHSRPEAIVLTHGHFDHVGALQSLADYWDVPIYAHRIEHPYLSGERAYPRPDPTVGGGLMSRLSPLYPRGPIDVGERLRALPSDGSVPALPSWRWIHTPGHTDGHVSLFRDGDRTLLAGDAIVTTRQESAIDVATQRELVWRPPAYYTTDWDRAWESVRELAALAPQHLATGHGHSLHGPRMRYALNQLAINFDEVRPRRGRYVRMPHREEFRRPVGRRRQRSTPTRLIGAAVAASIALTAVRILLKKG